MNLKDFTVALHTADISVTWGSGVCVCVCVCVCVFDESSVAEHVQARHQCCSKSKYTRWSCWLRHCTTSRKVPGSIQNEVFEIFYCHSFRPDYGSGVDSACKRNGYQGSFLRGKGGRCVGLTILQLLCDDCPEILGASTAWTVVDLSRSIEGSFTCTLLVVACWYSIKRQLAPCVTLSFPPDDTEIAFFIPCLLQDPVFPRHLALFAFPQYFVVTVT
jgi:hypothetical protein